MPTSQFNLGSMAFGCHVAVYCHQRGESSDRRGFPATARMDLVGPAPEPRWVSGMRSHAGRWRSSWWALAGFAYPSAERGREDAEKGVSARDRPGSPAATPTGPGGRDGLHRLRPAPAESPIEAKERP